MDDSKQKLMMLGGVLGFIVICFFGYMAMSGTSSSTQPAGGINTNLPINRLVEKYDERTNYSDASEYYNKVLPKVKSDTTNQTSKIWLGRLQEKHIATLSTEIKRFCRRDTMKKSHYRPLRDGTRSLLKDIEANENLKLQAKDLKALLNILYKFYHANELPKKIFSEGVHNMAFDERKHDEFRSKIKEIEDEKYISKNNHIKMLLKSSKRLLNDWQEDEERYISFKSKRDPVEIIMTNYKSFSGQYYQDLCDERRYQAYFSSFTDEAKIYIPGDNIDRLEYVLNDLNCQLIKYAPPSPILSEKDSENKEGIFYKDCLKIKKMYKNAKSN